MTAEELQTQINTLKAQLNSLLRDLMKEKIKTFFISLRNWVIWIFPLLAFLAIVALLYLFLKMSWEEFIELIKILIWPVTISGILFFFRKIFTYLFFSLEEFNFFGVKGALKNIQEVIDEKANELRDRERIEEQLKERIEYFEKETKKNQNLIQDLNKKEGVLEEWQKVAKEIFQDYKELNGKYIELYKKYDEKLKKEENTRIKTEIFQKLIEERGKERRDLPF